MATTKMRERCGVVAAAARDEVAPAIYFCLNALQHRGQEAAGIAIYNEKKQSIISFKGLGLVNEAFKDINLTQVPGSQGIGHTYYSIKFSTPENAQPTVVKTANGDIALAHNGIITNAAAIKKKLMDDGHTFNRGSEEESIAFMISDQLKHHSFEKAVKNVMRMLEGSYSLTLMHNNRVFGPFVLGKN